ncbi:GpE family phage tail protein [Paracoccaceae bacterium GXU_MW_L88]
MSVLAFVFHWQPSEMESMPVEDLLEHFEDAKRLHKESQPKPR